MTRTERMNMQSIEFEPEELSVAEQWHGGMSSMLYAIVSTGALKRGVERCRPDADCDHDAAPGEPLGPCAACRGRKMTDAQWLAYLASKLESEATSCADEARTRNKRARRARRRYEAQEMADHAVALDGIAAKCRDAIAKLGGAS